VYVPPPIEYARASKRNIPIHPSCDRDTSKFAKTG
jgi:hypothetical protein